MSSSQTANNNRRDSEEQVLLVRVNRGRQGERRVRLGDNTLHLYESKTSEGDPLVISRDCVLNVVRSSDSKQITIVGYPKINNRRTKTEILVEVGGEKEQDLLFSSLSYLNPQKRKKILVIINPFSGRKQAVVKWNSVKAMLDISEVEYEAVLTERAGHASSLIQTIQYENYGGIVVVSGDGLVHEVLNGVYNREDSKAFLNECPLGIIPGGSGNGISCSLLYQYNESFSDEVSVAGLNIARGESMPADYLAVQADTSQIASMLGVAWGLIPDCDIRSEVIRWMGFIRSYVWGAMRMVSPILYSGRVHYLPATTDSGPVDTVLPDIGEPVPGDWETVEGPFLTVLATKQAWMDYTSIVAPHIKYDDGFMYLLIVKGGGGRREMLYIMLNSSNEEYLNNSPNIIVKRVRAFRFDPDQANDPMSVDGENLSCSRVQGKVVPQAARLMLKNTL